MRRRTFGASLLGVGLLAATGCASGTKSGEDGKHVFTVADSFPPDHVISKNFPLAYMENVERASHGRITFSYFPSEQLGKAQDMLDLVRGGVADIGYIAPQYYSHRLPLGTVTGLPGAYSDAKTGSVAFHRLVTGDLYRAEIRRTGIQPLFSFVTGEYQVASAGGRVAAVDAMTGLRLRTAGGHMEMTAQDLGAVPVSIAAPEMYQAMERGTIDGALISAESLEPYGLDAIVKYYTTNLSLGGFGAFFAMNADKWRKLPPDLQKIMRDEGTRVARAGGAALTREKSHRLAEFQKAGMTLTTVPPAEVAKFGRVSAAVRADWLADMAARGLPGRLILDSFLGRAAR